MGTGWDGPALGVGSGLEVVRLVEFWGSDLRDTYCIVGVVCCGNFCIFGVVGV